MDWAKTDENLREDLREECRKVLDRPIPAPDMPLPPQHCSLNDSPQPAGTPPLRPTSARL